MSGYRMDRLNSLLTQEISSLILLGGIKDPRVNSHISVTRVEVSKDLSYGKVYVSSFLPDAQVKKAVEGLNSAAGYIQCVISKKLTIRKFPRLTFVQDEGMKAGFNMVNRLEALERERTAQDALEDGEHSCDNASGIGEDRKLSYDNVSGIGADGEHSCSTASKASKKI